MVHYVCRQIARSVVANQLSEARVGPLQESLQPICEFGDGAEILASRRHLDDSFTANESKGDTCPCDEGLFFVPICEEFIPDGSKRGGQERAPSRSSSV
jgi:hypothetical protein